MACKVCSETTRRTLARLPPVFCEQLQNLVGDAAYFRKIEAVPQVGRPDVMSIARAQRGNVRHGANTHATILVNGVSDSADMLSG